MTEHCDDQTDCQEEYNCEGKVEAQLCGTVRLHCECNCPEPTVYKTKIHQLPCDVKEVQVGAAVQNYLNANPLVELLSILDIGHAGWVLVLRVPV